MPTWPARLEWRCAARTGFLFYPHPGDPAQAVPGATWTEGIMVHNDPAKNNAMVGPTCWRRIDWDPRDPWRPITLQDQPRNSIDRPPSGGLPGYHETPTFQLQEATLYP